MHRLSRAPGRAALGLALASALLLAACDASGQVDPGLLTSAGTIRAENIAFEPTAITIRAGAPITITLENADDGIPHGLAITDGATQVVVSEIITGPGRTTVELPALGAGAYGFLCPVHPNMTGTLTVKP
jgi:plastocyanin